MTIGAVKTVFVQPKKAAPRDLQQQAEVEPQGRLSEVNVVEQMTTETKEDDMTEDRSMVADGEREQVVEETKEGTADDSSVPFFVKQEANEE
jgi:hypothetical protein